MEAIKGYTYDVESYENFFSAIFISTAPIYDKYVEAYLNAKVNKDRAAMDEALSHIDHYVFVLSKTTNDTFRFCDFMRLNLMLFGFNNHHYDDILINVWKSEAFNGHTNLEFTKLLNGYSHDIINSSFIAFDSPLYKYKVEKSFISVDLKKLHNLKNKGLKMVAIAMKFPFIQDLPINPYLPVPENQIDNLLEYNLNDVIMTLWMLKLKKDEFQSRVDGSKVYDVDVLSASRPDFAKEVLIKYIQKMKGDLNDRSFTKLRTQRKYIRFEDIINPNLDFEIPEFKVFFQKMKDIKLMIGRDEFSEVFIYKGVEYQFGMGGLHTKDRAGIFNATKNTRIVDIDADSFYPYLILTLGIAPKHLGAGLFLPIFRLITETRIDAKHKAKKDYVDIVVDKVTNEIISENTLTEEERIKFKKIAEILKIVINATFGQLKDQYSFLLDAKAFFQTTINGQLYLLKVCEQIILKGHEILSCNTDGIVSLVNRSTADSYFEVSEKTFNKYEITSEFTEYEKYVRLHVNSYITIKSDGEFKFKGFFEYDKLKLHDGFAKGFSMPIIAKAVSFYFLKGISIRDTIMNERDIYNFCNSSNIDRKYNIIARSIVKGKFHEEFLQKHLRYYISKRGKTIIKKEPDKTRETSLVAGEYITVFNDYVKYDDFTKYDIKYSYYISSAQKVIDEIEHKTTKSIKQYGGTLFD